MRILSLILIACTLPTLPAASRLKELVSIEGVRENQLVGYGLVVGLNGTGDRQQTYFSVQSLTNLLQRMGVTVPASAITVKNTAAVIVTASLPAFENSGARIDATVASIGDCSTLQGGLLVLTSLRGADGQVYAIAQGSVVTGSFAAGSATTGKTLNHPTAGRIPAGVTVERPAPVPDLSARIRLQLRSMDFTTASRIADVVNRKFSTPDKPIAQNDNARQITVAVPAAYTSRPAEFIAALENLTVETDFPSRVIVNERTGTIVMGKQVRVSPVAIMHGNLSVEVRTTYSVSQPSALSTGGTTQVVPQQNVTATQEPSRNLVLKEGATVEELMRALGAIGSTPRDIIAILQSLQAAGALEAEVEVM
jgi:flagellar P-ring protein precursor FlgI